MSRSRLLCLLSGKSAAIFSGGEEGFDHLCVLEVALELAQFFEPELIAAEISVPGGTCVGKKTDMSIALQKLAKKVCGD